jgi:hypothetical protein
MIEEFLETHLANKKQTRQFYFLASNFERTRIKDPRIDLLTEEHLQRKVKVEKNYLNEAFFPKERRMRLKQRDEIRAKNMNMIFDFVEELFNEIDEKRMGIFSEEQALFFYDLLGVNLNLSVYPKNYEFLYHPKTLDKEIIASFFTLNNEDDKIITLTNQLNSTERSNQTSTQVKPKNFKKFDKNFYFVEQNYFRVVLHEVIFSRVIFDKAKLKYFSQIKKRRELSVQLVRLRLKEVLTIFKSLLNKLVEEDTLEPEIVTDALNSLEDKIISKDEKLNIEKILKKLAPGHKLIKQELIELIIKEKAKTIEKELFAYQMGFFEKFLLENFERFPKREDQYLTIQTFFEFLEGLPKLQVSSRQKYMLWSFLCSSGFIKNSTLLDFVSLVSIVGFYIQEVISKLSNSSFFKLDEDQKRHRVQLHAGVLCPEQLGELICDDFEDFKVKLTSCFEHLKFNNQLISKIYQHQQFKRNMEDFEGVFDNCQKFYKINQFYGNMLKKFIIY